MRDHQVDAQTGQQRDALDLLRAAERLAPILAALRWLAALSAVPDPVNSQYGTAVPNLMRDLLAQNGL